MVGTISAAGRSASHLKWDPLHAAMAFLGGSVTGGFAWGAGVSLLGNIAGVDSWSPVISLVSIAMAAMLAILVELRVLKVPISPLPRQVPASWWIKYRGTTAAFLSGLHLGTGFLTHVTWAGYYAVVVLAFVVGWPESVVVLGSYGLIRGSQPLFVLVRTWRQQEGGERSLGQQHVGWLGRLRLHEFGVAGLALMMVVLIGRALQLG